ncbi:MAG TPA: hypothetical protein VF223_04080 [Trebonia sp.]
MAVNAFDEPLAGDQAGPVTMPGKHSDDKKTAKAARPAAFKASRRASRHG